MDRDWEKEHRDYRDLLLKVAHGALEEMQAICLEIMQKQLEMATHIITLQQQISEARVHAEEGDMEAEKKRLKFEMDKAAADAAAAMLLRKGQGT